MAGQLAGQTDLEGRGSPWAPLRSGFTLSVHGHRSPRCPLQSGAGFILSPGLQRGFQHAPLLCSGPLSRSRLTCSPPHPPAPQPGKHPKVFPHFCVPTPPSLNGPCHTHASAGRRPSWLPAPGPLQPLGSLPSLGFAESVLPPPGRSLPSQPAPRSARCLLSLYPC